METKTSLSNKSLSVLPVPLEHVEGMYEAAKDMTREKLAECVKRLALSHERLRAELSGASLLLKELQSLYDYLEQPDVLMSIPQPHRLEISRLLHGET